LTNVARHAQARHVSIGLESGPGRVVLRVVDDGRGFRGVPEENGGLRSMRERSLLVDGALAIKQAAGGGVEVRLEVPATPTGEQVGVAS
jgi:two-component system sensor histidine kinase UhpB